MRISPSGRWLRVPVLAALLVSTLGAREARARSIGITSNQFPSPVTGCNGCHTNATPPLAVAPTVTLTANNLSLQAGETITLTFTVTTPNGTPGAAGFNIRSGQAGTFATGGPDSANTQVLINPASGQTEATHSAPKQGEPAVFTVLWTPDAATTGTVTFTAWGNAVNLNGNNQGDMAATTTLDVAVAPPCTPTAWFPDADGDGFGAPTGSVSACTAPAGFVASNTDCNDGAAAVHPGATETCNGIDDNCNGTIDEGVVVIVAFRDVDGDGFGAASSGTASACSVPAGYSASNTDCNDGAAAIHPGATETCNGIDDNCNGTVDEGVTSTFFRDADGDGFGAASSGTAAACTAPAGYVASNTDCNDGAPAVHPGAAESCNGIDDNCSGAADENLGTVSCGIGSCTTTVPACVAGVPQVCVPVCPDAGSAEPDAGDGGMDAAAGAGGTAGTGGIAGAGGTGGAAGAAGAGGTGGSDAGAATDAGPRDATAMDAADAPRADAATPPGDAGAAADTGASGPGADAAADAGTIDVTSPPKGGCGCTVARTAPRGGGVLLVLAAAVIIARRRRR